MPRNVLVLALAASVSACASAATPPPSIAPDAQPSIDGLYRVDNSVLQFAEAKRDLDLTRYDAFMLGPVEVAYQQDPTVRTPGQQDSNFALTERQMETLKDTFRDEIQTALTEDDGYTLVEASGPNVLRLDAYLIDLVVRFDREATVGRSRQYTESYGEVTMILELKDSQSGEILARVADRRDPTRAAYGVVEVRSTLVRSDVTRMFRFWGTTLRERLDAVRSAELGGSGS
jgi:hypothetical protein